MSKTFDTYFLDSAEALRVARQNNRVHTGNPNVDGLQICYYDGLKLKKTPKNCINVPLENVMKFFSKTDKRLPLSVDFVNSMILVSEDKNKFIKYLHKVLEVSNSLRAKRIDKIKKKIKRLKLNFNDKKLRVFIPACRETTVMQYVSKDIAIMFKNLNYEVYYHSQGEMESCSFLAIAQELYKFNPHIVININHLNNYFLNDKVFNFIWFQDAMPILNDNSEIILRKRDYIFSYSNLFTRLLNKKGIKNNKIYKQDLIPVNTNKFYLDNTIERDDKIIFVGSYYEESRYSKYMIYEIDIELKNMLRDGVCLSSERIINVFAKYGKDIKHDITYINEIQQSYNRNEIVSWLSKVHSSRVEVYGYNWEKSKNSFIINKFKGKVNKTELNKLYNSSKYVLAVSGQVINTQRLGEIVHSGAIPVIYDSREITLEKESWNDECLYFKTEAELKYILDNKIKPKKYMTKKILNHFTYKKFIKTIEKQINKELENKK